MATLPLMPKATAVWLVDNTSLTFEQIADFCQLHQLEVKGIADGDVAQGIRGMDPMVNGQLLRDELEKAERNPAFRMQIAESKVEIPEVKTKRGPRYTPVSRRQDRPDAISWLLRYHPELTDGQVMKLVGTTKPTIQSIRDRSHWNAPNITPRDPVTVGLCSQGDLDGAVQKAAQRVERDRKKVEAEAIKAGTLLPTSETVTPEPVEPVHARIVLAEDVVPKPIADEDVLPRSPVVETPKEPVIDVDSVFGKLKDLDLTTDEKDAGKEEAETPQADVEEAATEEAKAPEADVEEAATEEAEAPQAEVEEATTEEAGKT